jgi:hypothetical protein
VSWVVPAGSAPYWPSFQAARRATDASVALVALVVV